MKRFLVIGLLVLVSSIVALAQSSTGRLTGTVSTPDGVLPGATVTATDNGTGREQTIVTNESGIFTFPQLDPGTYTVKITASGFKTFIANEVKIDVGREYTLDPALAVGGLEETVTVTAGADVVTATTAQVSNTVSPQQILSLPLIERNPLSLTTLQAGTQSNAFQETTINGMRTSFTNITRDGINIQDNYIRQSATDFAPGRPTVDDTAEFTIATANQEADQGYGGAQIRLVTPRGTSDFHGALFAYNRNSAFAANSFFNNRAGRYVATDPQVIAGTATAGDPRNPKTFRNRNQFGGKIGGPLPLPGFGEGSPLFYKDKGFFFFAYEKIIDPLSTTTSRTILTPEARAGNFVYNRTTAGSPISTPFVSCPSGAANSLCTANILGLANSLGFANTPTTINPVIQSRIIAPMPSTGNFTGLGDQRNTTGYRFNRRTDAERTNYTGRIDVDFDENNTINGVYGWVFEPTLRNDFDPTGYTDIPRADVASNNKTLALAYRRVISPTIINEVRGGLFFNNVRFNAYDNPGISLAVPLISNPENNSITQGRDVKNYNIQDNVDWIAGDHSLKFGGQIQYFRPTPFTNFGGIPTATIGTSTVTPFFTCATAATCQLPGGISAAQLGTGNSLLGLLAGYVTQFGQTFNLQNVNEGFAAAPSVEPWRYSNHSLYFMDRWAINRDLTITAGVRYEIYGALKLASGLALEPIIPDGVDPRTALLDRNGASGVVGGNSGKENVLYKNDYNNLAPQLGFAWAPKFEKGIGGFLLGKSFVLRGGYSHVFGNDQLVTSVLQAPGNITGLASRNGFALTPSGSAQLNLRLGTDPLPTIPVPPFSPLPPYSFIRNSTPPISGTVVGGTVFGVDPNLDTPMYKQYSIGIQREFLGNTALEIRYVGTRSNNLPRAYNLNQIDIVNNGFLADFQRAYANLGLPGATTPFCNPATVAGCQALTILRSSAAPTATTVGGAGAGPGTLLVGTGGLSLAQFNADLRAGIAGDTAVRFYQLGFNNHPTLANPGAVPYVNILPNPSAGLIALLTNDAYSRYNSLQIEVRRRFSQGLYFQANYTYSKNITNAIGGDQFYFEPYLDNNRPELDEQRSDSDQTHVFNFNGVYQLPFGQGKSFLNYGGLANSIFGGWEISGLMNWATGAPISIVDPRGTFNSTGRSGRQTAQSTLTADQIRALSGIFEANGNIYFIDPSVICSTGAGSNGYGQAPCPGQVFFNNAPGQTGNLPRTIINGPRFLNVNAALLKNIKFSESMRLQLRAEAFNLLNNTNFFNNTQVASINSTTFGQITSAGSPRIIQFGARFEF